MSKLNLSPADAPDVTLREAQTQVHDVDHHGGGALLQ